MLDRAHIERIARNHRMGNRPRQRLLGTRLERAQQRLGIAGLGPDRAVSPAQQLGIAAGRNRNGAREVDTDRRARPVALERCASGSSIWNSFMTGVYRREGSRARPQTWKDSPQPQRPFSLGLRKVNPD